MSTAGGCTDGAAATAPSSTSFWDSSPHKAGLVFDASHALAVLRRHGPSTVPQLRGVTAFDFGCPQRSLLANSDPTPIRPSTRRCCARLAHLRRIDGGFNNTTFDVGLTLDESHAHDGNTHLSNAAAPSTTSWVRLALRVSLLRSWPLFKLAGEVAAMRYLRSHPDSGPLLRRCIPEVYFVAPPVEGETDGMAVMCMPWIEGDTVGDPAVISRMAPASQRRLAVELAEFLAELQRVPVPEPIVQVSRMVDTTGSSSRTVVGRIAATRAPTTAVDDSCDARQDGVASDSATQITNDAHCCCGLASLFDFGCCPTWPNRGPFATLADYHAEICRLRLSQIATLRDHFTATTEPGAAAERCTDAVVPIAALDAWKEALESVATFVEEHRLAIGRQPSVVCHYDFCGRNFLVDLATGKLQAVLDWEWACSNPAVQDWFEGLDDVGPDFRRMVWEEGARIGALPGRGNLVYLRETESVTLRQPAGSDSTTAATNDADHALNQFVYRLLDNAFPWEISAHMHDPARFPCEPGAILETARTATALIEKLLGERCDIGLLPPAMPSAPA